MLEQGLDKTSALVEEAYQLIQSGGLLDSGAVERLSRKMKLEERMYPLIGGALGVGVGAVLRAVAPGVTRGPLGALTTLAGSALAGAYLGDTVKSFMNKPLGLSVFSSPEPPRRGGRLLEEKLGITPDHHLVASVLWIDSLQMADRSKTINLSVLNLAQLVCVAFEDPLKALVRSLEPLSAFLSGKRGEHYAQRLSEFAQSGLCTLAHVEALLYALKRVAQAGALDELGLTVEEGWLARVEVGAVQALREMRNDAAHGRVVPLSLYDERCASLLGAPSFTAWFTGEGVTEPASWFEEYLERRAPVCA
jgi:hypothetical protein